jgi:hypothetical protein
VALPLGGQNDLFRLPVRRDAAKCSSASAGEY